MNFKAIGLRVLLGALTVLTLIGAAAGKWVPRIVEAQKPSRPSLTAPVYLPVVFNNFDGSLGTPIFGVQMYGSTAASSPYHPYILGGGASWVRVQVNWQTVEQFNTTPENMQWAHVDNLLSVARPDAGGLNVIATIDRWPEWAREVIDEDPRLTADECARCTIDSEDLPEFAEFVTALVERYDGDGISDAPGSPQVLYWEFVNEPDGRIEAWDPAWGDHGLEYATMLSFAYPALKTANPQAQLVFGGVAYDWFEDQNGNFVREFLDDVFLNGGGSYFDIMNFHAYPVFAPNWLPPGGHGPGVVEKAAAIRAKLAEYGLESKPLFLTEAGWHSNPEEGLPIPGSEEIQARFVVQIYAQSMAADIDATIWWMMHDPGGLYNDNGLVTNISDGPVQTKLAYTVFQASAAMLSQAHFERILPASETGHNLMEVLQFVDLARKKRVYVAWLDPVDTVDSAWLHLTAPEATVIDFDGTTKANLVSDLSGTISIEITGRPLFVEVPN